MMRKLALVLSLGLGACIFNPARGTKPADMTAQAHLQECRSHEQRAQAAEKRVTETPAGDGYDGTFRDQYVAGVERDAAARHGAAAKAVDPNAGRCP